MEAASPQFDRLFEAILIPTVDRGGQPARRRRKCTPDEETRIRRAMSLFHRGDYPACIEAMKALQEESVIDSRVEAFLAASRAIGLRETNAGLKSCVAAVKKAGPVADVFCALGAVFLGIEDRARAHAVFRKGLAIDPLHPHLRAHLRSMGVRKPPVLRSLRRNHPMNRVLGALRARFAEA